LTRAGSDGSAAAASDGTLSNSKTFTWTVTNVDRAPTLTQPGNRTDAENTAPSITLVGSDPDGDTLTYSATSLPPGMSVNASTGMIAGTPTLSSAATYTRT